MNPAPLPAGHLPVPPALAGVDLAAHRQRAIDCLTLLFDRLDGDDVALRIAQVMESLDRVGIAPVWLADPAFEVKQRGLA